MTTVGENITKGVAKTIEKNRQAGRFVRPSPKLSAKSFNDLKLDTSSIPSPKEKQTTLTVDEVFTKKNINEMTVEEFENYSNSSVLTAEEASEFEKRKEELETKSAKNGKTPEAAKIKRDKNPDEDYEDDDKFDIQQGDFIDFLMKEVVLASAAWAGKKVSGRINLALYNVSSDLYHKASDVVESGWEGVCDLYKDAKENMNNIKKNLGAHKISYHQINSAPENYQNIYNAHNSEIDDSKQRINDSEAISRLCMEAVGNDELKIKENNGKSFWYDSESGRTIPLDDKYVRTILTKAQQIHKNTEKLDLTPEQKKNLYKTTANNMAMVLTDAFAIRTQAKIFAANMATAQMIKDSANEETAGRPREEYLANYEKDFFIIMKKLRNNEDVGDIKSLNDLVALSDNARATACNNQSKNRPDALNDYLTIANSLNSHQERQQSAESLYSAALGSKLMSNLNQIHSDLEREIQSLEHAQSNNNQRRERLQNTREALSGKQNQAQPRQQQTPVIGQGRENR